MTAFKVYRDEFTKMFPDIDGRCFIPKPISISDLVKKVNEEFHKEYDADIHSTGKKHQMT